MTLSEKLKHIRELLGLTQSDFAEKLQVSQQSISSIERGANKDISLDLFKKLVNILHINPFYFLTDDKEPEFIVKNNISELRKKIKDYEALVDKLLAVRGVNKSH